MLVTVWCKHCKREVKVLFIGGTTTWVCPMCGGIIQDTDREKDDER